MGKQWMNSIWFLICDYLLDINHSPNHWFARYCKQCLLDDNLHSVVYCDSIVERLFVFLFRSTHFSQICTPSNPIEFFVRIDFQQTLSPQPVSYGLNTLFELLHNLQSFLRDPSLIQNPLELEANHYFRKGQYS